MHVGEFDRRCGVLRTLLGITAGLLGASAIAQTPDWQTVGSCIRSPVIAASAGCVASDFDSDSHVTVVDAMMFQVSQGAKAGIAPCATPSDMRWYAGATQPQDSLTGTRSFIDYYRSVLCNEPTSSTEAFVAVWAGVSGSYYGTGPFDLIWAQTGYIIHRNRLVPGTQVFVQKYTEIHGGPLSSQYQIQYYSAPLSGSREWQLSLFLPTAGTWEFVHDGEVLLYGNVNGWANQRGIRADYVAELQNWGNQMPGTATNKVRFQQCASQIASGDFEAVMFEQANIQNTDPVEYGAELAGANTVQIWDRHP